MSFTDQLTGTAPPQSRGPIIDPYGLDLAIDATGDLRVTPSGSVAGVSGAYNCAQAVWLRLKTSIGDLPLHPDYGSRLALQFVGSKLNAGALITELNGELQDLLANDARFTDASVAAVQQPATTGQAGSIQIEATATLAGGEQLTLGDVTDPTPSDVSLPAPAAPSIDPTITFDPTVEQELFADQPETDTLNDLDQVSSIVNDIPSSGILGPLGGRL